MISKIRKNICSVIAFALIVLLLCVIAFTGMDSDTFSAFFKQTCIAVRGYVGSLCCLFLLVLVALAFSKYGKIRLGGKDAKPEYSNFSWFSCLFMAGMGIGIMFYCQESLFHLHSNPYVGRVSGSPEAIAYSLTLYDWTFNAWGLYAMLGLIIAYFHFNMGRELKISSIFPMRFNYVLRRAIDIVMALGIVAGLCTSLGLGVAQLCGGFKYVFHVNANPYILMMGICLIATWSVNSGLKRGVKWLSNSSTILVGVLVLLVIMFAYLTHSISSYGSYIGKGLVAFFGNYIFYNDYFNPKSDDWAASWAVFYQMWYAAWAAFVSVFVAKISKGRSIREFILGVLIMPSLITMLWFGVYGTIGTEIKDLIFPAMQNDITSSLFVFIENITTSHLAYLFMSAIVLVTICLFFITSSDSSSFVVATLLTPDKEAWTIGKVSWSMTQCFSAMVLFACGGLALVQMASVILGVIVITIILAGMCYFIYTLIKNKALEK